MSNKDKFAALVSDEKTNTIERNRERIKNRVRLRESQAIALKVLTKLDEPGWSQKRLAAEMGVSPQQITKIVKGKENLTLETQVKLQCILNIPILATYYENLIEQIVSVFQVKETKKFVEPFKKNVSGEDSILLAKQEFKMAYDLQPEEETYYLQTA